MTREKFNVLCAVVEMAGIAREAKMRPEEFVIGLCNLEKDLEERHRSAGVDHGTTASHLGQLSLL